MQITGVSINAAYVPHDADIELDKNIPGFTINALFSTAAAIAVTNPLVYKNRKFEHILDPAVQYHSANDKGTYGKYFDIINHKYSDGAATWGIGVSTWVIGSFIVDKGTKMVSISGCPADGYFRLRLW